MHALHRFEYLVYPASIVLSLLPLLLIVIFALFDRLGANPAEAILRETGIWTLRFLLMTLCITPLRLLMGWGALNKRFELRKTLGLFAFFYGSLHMICYVWLDQSFDGVAIFKDLVTRPAIMIGFLSFMLMLPLAITSHRSLVQYLGKVNWKRLHWLMYPITIGGVVHFWWLAQSKADIREPVIYAILLVLLLVLRYPPLTRKNG